MATSVDIPLARLFNSKIKPTVSPPIPGISNLDPTFSNVADAILPNEKRSHYEYSFRQICDERDKRHRWQIGLGITNFNKSACLTSTCRPLLCAMRITGIFPITPTKTTCHFHHSWKSTASLINLAAILLSVITSALVFHHAIGILQNFKGSDFYTMVMVMTAQFISTILVFVVGNISAAPNFCKGWDLLHNASDNLKFDDYQRVKFYLLFVPLCLTMEGAFNTYLLKGQMEMDQDSKLNLKPWLGMLSSFVGNFVPNFITCSLAVFLWISAYLFDFLNTQVQNCVENGQADRTVGNDFLPIHPRDVSGHLAQLRQLHENLCDGVRFITSAFGFQLLLIFPATGFRFIVGLYAVLLSFMGLSPKNLRGLVFYQGLASIVAGSRIMLVLLSSDLVMRKAMGCVGSLKRARSPRNSEDLNQEIDVFLSKLGTYPLEIRCCGIITLNLSFLATAIPNVITYLLVLMQFKQGDDNDAWKDSAANHSHGGQF